MEPIHGSPKAPMFPGFLRHRAQLPTCPTSPKAPRTHPIQSSEICGRVARPATNQADFLTPVDDAAAVHPDDPAYGPVSPAAAAPRAFALPTRHLPHVRPAPPASFGRKSGPHVGFDYGTHWPARTSSFTRLLRAVAEAGYNKYIFLWRAFPSEGYNPHLIPPLASERGI